ncbi:amidase domain-containing protein [Streptomyces sp. NPDC101118]|uniref:amidase domain-containing protein n=1 Tax=Streptomyces sp. NPDC101118 TaxID=3366109 RepID=UPI003819CCBA
MALASLAITAPATHAHDAALSDADTSALGQMADTLLQRRADAVTTTPQPRMAAEPVPMTDAAADDLAGDLAVLQHNAQALQKINGGYSRAEVTVTDSETSLSGDTATVKVNERTRLYFPNPDPGAPAYEEYALPHTMTFTRSTDGGWDLAEDQANTDSSAPAPSTQISEPIEDPGPINEPGPHDPAPGEETAPESQDEGQKEQPSSTVMPASDVMALEVKPMVTASYNYNNMVNYARRFALTPNPGYRKYDNDCTNFISQAMRSGGWATTSGSMSSRGDNRKWFYGNYTWTTSYTWAGAENWYWFATRHSGRTKPLDNVWKMLPSDVLQADWGPYPNDNINHTMIVTAKSSSEIYLSYHTSNTYNKKLSTLIAEKPRTWWYAHRT